MNPFAMWEEPTEYVDYKASCNPRANWYQNLGESSSGNATAITLHELLDIAIGTDSKQGLFVPSIA